MNLFKRLLLSLFPRMFGWDHWPAWVFLSLINAKHFFTVMSKRMVEHPKLNFFDIWLDPLETKIWFGPEAIIKPKDIEAYYSYCATANLNGYKSFSVMNISTLLSICYSQFLYPYFEKNKKWIDMLMVVLMTINIIPYVYISWLRYHNKNSTLEQQYNAFIIIFCDLLRFVASIYAIKLTKKQIEYVKTVIVNEYSLFLALFYICDDISFYIEDSNDQEVMYWLSSFRVDINEEQIENIVWFTEREKGLLKYILPVEFMTKLLYDRSDVFWVAEYIVPHVYEPQVFREKVQNFIDSKRKFLDASEFYVWLMNHVHWKKSFFPSIRKMIVYKFSTSDPLGKSSLEEFLSTISDESWMLLIPESIKKESALMDRLLNFYVGLMGTMFIAKADNGYFRLFHAKELNSLITIIWSWAHSDYFDSIISKQRKLEFFYNIVFDGVRSWKASFIVPYIAQETVEYSNKTFLLRQYLKQSFAILTQDIVPKDVKLVTHNNDIVTEFQSTFGESIERRIDLNQLSFVEDHYKSIDQFIWSSIGSHLSLTISSKELKNIKESAYSLEYWLYNDFIKSVWKSNLCSLMNSTERCIFAAFLRDSLFGCCILYCAMLRKSNEKWITVFQRRFLTIYFQYVLWCNEVDLSLFVSLTEDLCLMNLRILNKICEMDDNPYFLEVGLDCRLLYVNKHEQEDEFLVEDELRLYGYLKHVTYYNKRLIIPNY